MKQKQTHVARTTLSVFALLLWVFVGIVISQVVLGAIALSFLGDALYTPAWMTAYTAISYALSILLVVFVPLQVAKRKESKSQTTPPKKSKNQPTATKATPQTFLRTDLGLTGLPKWRDLGLGIAGFIAYFVLAALLVYLFTIFPWFDPDAAQNLGFSGLGDTSQRLLAFVALVIVAPIAEEILFRGWLYAKLRAKVNIWLAILLVSALFGFAHGAWNVGVNVFAMSVVMCLLRELTGTIWGGVILHILKNALAFYLLMYTGAL